MSNRLHYAAKTGDVNMLNALLHEDPGILDSTDVATFADTPLHIAASSSGTDGRTHSSHGKARFAVEVAILKPSFTKKLNPEGLTPMHLALLNGQWEMVRALRRLDSDLIRVKGKGGKTPLHVAAEVAPPQLLAELLIFCPASIEDVTSKWQSALHLAVEAKNLDSFEVLLGWMVRTERENLLYWRDMDGNTALHVATRTNQIQVIKRLLKHIDDSVKNFMGETALDMHENGLHPNAEVGRVLLESRRGNMWVPLFSKEHSFQNRRVMQQLRDDRNFKLGEHLSSDLGKMELCKRRIKRTLDNMGVRFAKSKEIFIVVAVLVATATYRGILTPPGGLCQDSTCSGKMIMNGKSLCAYVTLNSCAFSLSVVGIVACIPADVAFSGYLMITMTLMLYTYLFAVSRTLPPKHTILRIWLHMVLVEFSFLGPMAILARILIITAQKLGFKLDEAEIGHKGQVVEYDEDDNTRSSRRDI